MNKYRLTWYVGSVSKVEEKISSKEIETEEPIDKINFASILPNSVKKKSFYYRIIYISEDIISIDYGEYSRFVLVERI